MMRKLGPELIPPIQNRPRNRGKLQGNVLPDGKKSTLTCQVALGHVLRSIPKSLGLKAIGNEHPLLTIKDNPLPILLRRLTALVDVKARDSEYGVASSLFPTTYASL